jgi:hypothetical protein
MITSPSRAARATEKKVVSNTFSEPEYSPTTQLRLEYSNTQSSLISLHQVRALFISAACGEPRAHSHQRKFMF